MWEEGGKQEGWRSHLETVETRQNNDRDNDNEAEYTAHVVGVNERDECAALPMPLALALPSRLGLGHSSCAARPVLHSGLLPLFGLRASRTSTMTFVSAVLLAAVSCPALLRIVTRPQTKGARNGVCWYLRRQNTHRQK